MNVKVVGDDAWCSFDVDLFDYESGLCSCSCIGVVGCWGRGGKGKGERGNADECPADLLY